MGKPKDSPDGTFRWCSGHAEWLPKADFAPTAHYCHDCASYLALRSHRRKQRGERKPRPKPVWFSYVS